MLISGLFSVQKSKLLTIRVMHLFMNVSYFLAAICFSGENPNVHAWGDVFRGSYRNRSEYHGSYNYGQIS